MQTCRGVAEILVILDLDGDEASATRRAAVLDEDVEGTSIAGVAGVTAPRRVLESYGSDFVDLPGRDGSQHARYDREIGLQLGEEAKRRRG